jgi:conjugative transfer pilus assembly protein TraH
MNVKNAFRLCALIGCMAHDGAAGTMANQLKEYFAKSGGGSNLTAPSTYQNQSAGYYNGGSFYGRVPVQTTQIANLQLPGFRAGCGGIDAWMGGFSHIRADALVGALRGIMSNMGSYAFMLALESLSPEIYNVMNELNALAQKINGLNINTCEAAATALGGILPKSDATSKHLCQAMGSNYGGLSDWTAARHDCGVGGQRSKILDGDHESLKSTLKDEFNLVWQAIQKNSFLAKDKNLAELFMTLAGTLIVKRQGSGKEVSYDTIHKKSKAIDQNFIKAVLHGGSVDLYHCGTDTVKCLNLTDGNKQTINVQNDSLIAHVRKILSAIIEKIYNDGVLEKDEQNFLTSTTLPIYKILNVLTAYKKGHAPIEIESYAELIALDILNRFLLDVLDIVEESISYLRKAQVSDEAIKEYLASLNQVRALVMSSRESAMVHMNATLSMIKSVQMVEKQLHVYLGTLSSSNESSWAQ